MCKKLNEVFTSLNFSTIGLVFLMSSLFLIFVNDTSPLYTSYSPAWILSECEIP